MMSNARMLHGFKSFLSLGIAHLGALSGLLHAQGPSPTPVAPEFWFSEPVPALLAAAEGAGMPTSGLADACDRSGMAKGDGVTALVEHVDGSKRRQWLVLLAGSELSEQDRALPAPTGMRLFTSTGNEIVFAGSREALAIHVLGPVPVSAASAETNRKKRDAAVSDVWSGALVNGDFLQLGFTQASSTWLRLRDARDAAGVGQGKPLGLSASGAPFPPDAIAAGQAFANSIGLTPEDERAMFAVVPALMEFFGVAARTPGLSDILTTVVDVPVWSIVARGGRMPSVEFSNLPITAPIDPLRWGLPEGTEAYECAFVLMLNKRPSLVVRFAVVRPRPPLVASAGIVGLTARRPDGKGPQLMIRVVASRAAESTIPAQP